VLQQLRAITQDRKSTAAEIAPQKLVVASGYDKQEAKQNRCVGNATSLAKKENFEEAEHHAQGKQRKQSGSGRKIDRYNAWVAINVNGRWVTMKDREQYWRDMSNQKNRAYYIEKAREMNEGKMLCDSAFSSVASQRKRVRQPRDHSLEWAMRRVMAEEVALCVSPSSGSPHFVF
jgi:hypothetical protein